MPIGVFDSGVGGVVVLRELVRELPEYDYVYLADNAHVPYGERSLSDIRTLTARAIEQLFSQGCPLVVLACNTATAASLRWYQQEVLPVRFPNCRVLGVIRPAAEAALQDGVSTVGVVATTATVESAAFVHELQHLQPSVRVIQAPAPALVPIIESSREDWQAMAVDKLLFYVQPLVEAGAEKIVLGCTHFGVLAEAAQPRCAVPLMDEATVVAKRLRWYLERHPEMAQRLTQHGERHFFATRPSEEYAALVSFFFGAAGLTLCRL